MATASKLAKGFGCAVLFVGNVIGIFTIVGLTLTPFLPGDCAPDVDCRAAHSLPVVAISIWFGALLVFNLAVIAWLLLNEKEDQV